MKTILVTGGCGFIGSNFVRLLNAETDWRIVNYDKLTYAGNLENVAGLSGRRNLFVHGDICDLALLEKILKDESPWAIVNFAAESHVDRSIIDATPFLITNIIGVQTLLEAVRHCPVERFLQVSTDEVYGDKEGKASSAEDSPLVPSSPYAATKAAADLLCFSYHRTYGLPVVVTRSSNNYGPYQFPEKLIPLLIRNGLDDMELPIYGDGKQVRDWLYVEDHCRAIYTALENGKAGSVFNIGTGEERSNRDIAEEICVVLAERTGRSTSKLKGRICSVPDRPGHDRRYALDTSKIRDEIGWWPRMDFPTGLRKTVDWYLDHSAWISRVTSGGYQQYYDLVYAKAWGKGRGA